MSIQKKIQTRSRRRTYRVRNHLKEVNRAGRLRISVYRSNKEIYAQLIDDKIGTTLTSFSSKQLGAKSGDKTAQAHQVGVELGKRAVEFSSERGVFFDRGKYLYHGRVKALADGLRESGLQL